MSRLVNNFKVKKYTKSTLKNVQFYSDEIPCQPDNIFLKEIHSKWYFDFQRLEYSHGYIQWLFPLFEGHGVNPQAYALTSEECEIFKNSKELQEKLFISFEMMMNFYGIKLNKDNLEMSRNEDWILHYENLEHNPHNFLRITRILKSIGFLGLSEFKKPFLKFVSDEIFSKYELTSCKHSFVNFWLPTLEKEEEMKEIIENMTTM
eukprot:gene9004-1103_t